jgi:hypothetical protein
LFFYFCVFRDASFLARSNGPFSALGQLWATIAVMMTLALIYKSIFSMAPIAYPFWFYSGVVASKALQLRLANRAQERAATPVPTVPWHATATDQTIVKPAASGG